MRITFFIIITFIFFIIFIIYYIINKYAICQYENFMINKQITTWTPYIIDSVNQPAYSNYFYNNGYMYPIY